MISLKNPNQIAKMREAGKILREVEDEVRLAIKPGVTTAELDILAERLIRKNHAIPSSLHYEGYPCSICASINDEVVHGIPSDRRVLKDGVPVQEHYNDLPSMQDHPGLYRDNEIEPKYRNKLFYSS